jgi:hypothetical protein
MVAYRCEVAGVPTDSIDIQVRYFDDPTTDIASFLREEPVHSYLNDHDEVVTWPIVDILALQDMAQPQNGREVVGFITGCDEFAKWTCR